MIFSASSAAPAGIGGGDDRGLARRLLEDPPGASRFANPLPLRAELCFCRLDGHGNLLI